MGSPCSLFQDRERRPRYAQQWMVDRSVSQARVAGSAAGFPGSSSSRPGAVMVIMSRRQITAAIIPALTAIGRSSALLSASSRQFLRIRIPPSQCDPVRMTSRGISQPGVEQTPQVTASHPLPTSTTTPCIVAHSMPLPYLWHAGMTVPRVPHSQFYSEVAAATGRKSGQLDLSKQSGCRCRCRL